MRSIGIRSGNLEPWTLELASFSFPNKNTLSFDRFYVHQPIYRVSHCGRGRLVAVCYEFDLVQLMIHHVGERCTLNLPRAQTSSGWCGVTVRRGIAKSGVVLVT
ncbi:hypothetical protein TNCV_3811901 [Trichonephila clavipes]|nr:hypothetical protein TNCV_3811901 [Trichonephila clavipes]